MTDLGTLGGTSSQAYGISANGSTVVGQSLTSSSLTHAFRWTQAGGMTDLGTLGGTLSYAYGTSADGSVVVGYAATASTVVHAFRWTSGTMTDIGALGGASVASRAWGVSADGSTVVGQSLTSSSRTHAFLWTQAGGMTDLGTLGGTMSVAEGVSADGSVVVGYAATTAPGTHAFRWTSGTMSDLGNLGSDSYAMGVSLDGKVVVGRSYISSTGSSTLGFRWTQATGMQSVEDWLRAGGVSIPADVTSQANATNSDGSVVVGTLKNHHAFIARERSGLVDEVDFNNSLYATATGSSTALRANATLINGAHGQPLIRRVEAGKSTFWVAGDWGRDDYGSRSGDIGLAEVGLGHNFGAFQLNMSAGQTWARQDLLFNGSAKTDGTYLLAEALVPVAGDLWATFGGYGEWGQANLNRGYMNATVQDYSSSKPDINTWGVRARLDWENSLSLGNGSLAPYVDLTYSEAKMDAYTETGGGFAARFDSRNERSTTLRLGTNGSWPLSGTTRLFSSLEADHRFEKTNASTTGQVIGLSDFSLPGQSVKRDWLRAGVGVEGKIGGGIASLSVNATTTGDMPNYWLAANWRVTF